MSRNFPNYKKLISFIFLVFEKTLFFYIKYSIELGFLLFKIQVESGFIENEER